MRVSYGARQPMQYPPYIDEQFRFSGSRVSQFALISRYYKQGSGAPSPCRSGGDHDNLTPAISACLRSCCSLGLFVVFRVTSGAISDGGHIDYASAGDVQRHGKGRFG
jgi:hypothetical protein